jgi:hypothetical protein
MHFEVRNKSITHKAFVRLFIISESAVEVFVAHQVVLDARLVFTIEFVIPALGCNFTAWGAIFNIWLWDSLTFVHLFPIRRIQNVDLRFSCCGSFSKEPNMQNIWFRLERVCHWSTKIPFPMVKSCKSSIGKYLAMLCYYVMEEWSSFIFKSIHNGNGETKRA